MSSFCLSSMACAGIRFDSQIKAGTEAGTEAGNICLKTSTLVVWIWIQRPSEQTVPKPHTHSDFRFKVVSFEIPVYHNIYHTISGSLRPPGLRQSALPPLLKRQNRSMTQYLSHYIKKSQRPSVGAATTRVCGSDHPVMDFNKNHMPSLEESWKHQNDSRIMKRPPTQRKTHPKLQSTSKNDLDSFSTPHSRLQREGFPGPWASLFQRVMISWTVEFSPLLVVISTGAWAKVFAPPSTAARWSWEIRQFRRSKPLGQRGLHDGRTVCRVTSRNETWQPSTLIAHQLNQCNAFIIYLYILISCRTIIVFYTWG